MSPQDLCHIDCCWVCKRLQFCCQFSQDAEKEIVQCETYKGHEIYETYKGHEDISNDHLFYFLVKLGFRLVVHYEIKKTVVHTTGSVKDGSQIRP